MRYFNLFIHRLPIAGLTLIAFYLFCCPDARAAADTTYTQQTGVSYSYGMNLGAYFAHPGTANYYNGSGGYGLSRLLASSYQYNRIRDDLGHDFSLHALPQNMQYNPAIMLGFFGQLHLNPLLTLSGEFNYAKLRTEDQFTLVLDRYSSIQGDNIERFPVRGEEERIDLRLGIQLNRPSKHSYIHPFLEAGLSITDTEAKTNTVRIGSRSYNVRRPTDPRQTTYYHYERDYGMSAGGYAALGMKMEVTPHFHFTLAYSSQYIRINLGENKAQRWQHSIFVRLNLNNLTEGESR